MSSVDADSSGPKPLRVGVLALQGSFREHISALRRCGSQDWLRSQFALEAVEVRKTEQLQGLHGLIIPGGESTTMAHVAERNNMIPAMKEFEASGAPIWGTCAGLIFLADRALGQKMGGQALLGGLDCTVHRNFFGSQINSFETDLPSPPEFSSLGGTPPPPADAASTAPPAASLPFRAVFIRAPAIVETGPEVEVLSEYRVKKAPPPQGQAPAPASEGGSAEADAASAEQQQLDKLEKVAVAVRQGKLLATAFHPELTADLRWHLLFLAMVTRHIKEATGDAGSAAGAPASSIAVQAPADPGNLPIYGSTGKLSIELKN